MGNNLDKQYIDLLKDIVENGTKKATRNGGTISVFGRPIRHRMSEGFPLLTSKRMYTKGIITELLWFLRGETNIRPLVLADCHIWNGDAYKKYVNFFKERIARRDGKMGSELKSSNEERMKYGKLEFHDNYDHGNGDTFSSYEPLSKEEFIERIKTDSEFANIWGELGPIYGAGWRNWGGKSDDKLYEDYLKKVKEK